MKKGGGVANVLTRSQNHGGGDAARRDGVRCDGDAARQDHKNVPLLEEVERHWGGRGGGSKEGGGVPNGSRPPQGGCTSFSDRFPPAPSRLPGGGGG
jgi:hypothetical protein